MKHIVLDCAPLSGEKAFHEALFLALEFPEYYGRNLDALYDCLSTLSEPTHLVLKHFDALEPRLGEKAPGFVSVFDDASQCGHFSWERA